MKLLIENIVISIKLKGSSNGHKCSSHTTSDHPCNRFVYSSTTLEASKVILHGSRGRRIHGRTWEEATDERHVSLISISTVFVNMYSCKIIKFIYR